MWIKDAEGDLVNLDKIIAITVAPASDPMDVPYGCTHELLAVAANESSWCLEVGNENKCHTVREMIFSELSRHQRVIFT